MTRDTAVAVIEVRITEKDGWSYATSPDMPELHVCGTNRRAVMKDVCMIVQRLYKLNYDLDISVNMAATPDLKPAKKSAGFKDLVRLLAFSSVEMQPA